MADDLLKPEEIEALLKSAGARDRRGAGGVPGGLPTSEPQAAARPAGLKGEPKPKSPTERLLEQAEAAWPPPSLPTCNPRRAFRKTSAMRPLFNSVV